MLVPARGVAGGRGVCGDRHCSHRDVVVMFSFVCSDRGQDTFCWPKSTDRLVFLEVVGVSLLSSSIRTLSFCCVSISTSWFGTSSQMLSRNLFIIKLPTLLLVRALSVDGFLVRLAPALLLKLDLELK